MGLMDKIEGKLHGGSKQQAPTSSEKPLYSSSERQHIEQQANLQNPNSSSTSGQNAMGGSTSTGGDRTHDLRHPVQSATGRAGEGQYGQPGTYGSGTNKLDYNNDGYGETAGGRQKIQAHDPVDPRSVRDQNAIYDNSDRADTHNYSHRDHGYGRSNEQGATNAMSNDNYGSGGRSALENHSAIPTAGGEKVGGLGSGSEHERHSGQGQHHYGRDAAVVGGAGGAGAIGMEEYERRNQHSSGKHGHHGLGHHNQPEQYGGNTMGSSGQQDSSYSSYPNRSHADDVMMGGNGSRAGGHGLGHGHSSERDHGVNQPSSGGMHETSSGLPTEKKLGGAYEAGYRDAMAHAEAERQRQV
ncbi:hypothetical protein B0A55_04772 [Friedmanniomyces simplex]|uniref:Uncharacterized protein n=1 Tax=Friedmanniomyces simplex TaxID=329884 RepID=A0A4U0XJU1_9PEZI|nr:hypothetical protein B0A55_04772 [Friedmanniomyces simplex]